MHCHTLPFKIELRPGAAPIASRSYRTNPIVSQQVDRKLDMYLAAGLIERFASPWTSPLVGVLKKDNPSRITVDYKHLNAASTVSEWPVPRIDAVLDSLGKERIYSTCGLMSGFF